MCFTDLLSTIHKEKNGLFVFYLFLNLDTVNMSSKIVLRTLFVSLNIINHSYRSSLNDLKWIGLGIFSEPVKSQFDMFDSLDFMIF